ncbi:MAG: ABC transporter permease [Candidatus Promineifilaceae bacterium]
MQENSIVVGLESLEQTHAEYVPESFWAQVWGRFRKNKMSVVGLIVLIGMAIAAVSSPLFAVDPTNVDLSQETRLQPPSKAHIFGTDNLGRDVLARSMFGARISLTIGFVSSALAITIGTVFGSIAGFYGGLLDDFLMRFIDLILSLPLLFVLIILQSLLDKPSLFSVILVIGVTSWMGSARVVRGEVLKEREIEYVDAARALGATPLRIIFRHLLPNVIGPVIVISTLQVGRAIILEASLSFLGFGTQPPNASWGAMLSEARSYLATGPWMAIFPGLLLSFTVLSFNFIGDGLAFALNPHQRK